MAGDRKSEAHAGNWPSQKLARIRRVERSRASRSTKGKPPPDPRRDIAQENRCARFEGREHVPYNKISPRAQNSSHSSGCYWYSQSAVRRNRRPNSANPDASTSAGDKTGALDRSGPGRGRAIFSADPQNRNFHRSGASAPAKSRDAQDRVPESRRARDRRPGVSLLHQSPHPRPALGIPNSAVAPPPQNW